jgi:gas vesicle protein
MAHQHSVNDSPAQLAGIAALSAAVGALTAIIFMPRSGSETRHQIRQRARNIRSTVQNRQDVAVDTSSESTDRLAGTMGAARQRAKSTFKKIQDNAAATKRDLHNTVDQASSDVQDEVDHIRKHGER